jgi:hypothetical protein
MRKASPRRRQSQTSRTRIRRKSLRLTEDQADILFCEKHKHDKEYTLEEVRRQAGYAVER